MHKMTKKLKCELEHILYELNAGIEYLYAERTIVCVTHSVASTTEHYTRTKEPNNLYPINKYCGSDLCRIYTAYDHLRRLLYPEQS